MTPRDLGPPEFVICFRGLPMTVRVYRHNGRDFWYFPDEPDLCEECTAFEAEMIADKALDFINTRSSAWRGKLFLKRLVKRGIPLSDDVGAA